MKWRDVRWPDTSALTVHSPSGGSSDSFISKSIRPSQHMTRPQQLLCSFSALTGLDNNMVEGRTKQQRSCTVRMENMHTAGGLWRMRLNYDGNVFKPNVVLSGRCDLKWGRSSLHNIRHFYWVSTLEIKRSLLNDTPPLMVSHLLVLTQQRCRLNRQKPLEFVPRTNFPASYLLSIY